MTGSLCRGAFGSKEEARADILWRIQRYREGLKQYRSPLYNETQVRVDFINPFFRALGWDVDNSAGLPQHFREVTHEAVVSVEENGRRRTKKPDYSFKVGTETLFYLEAKKPYVDITSDPAPAFQLRRYGWSGNLKISVLTNYHDLYLYDCTVRPMEYDDVGTALIAHYTYEEYGEKFDEIYSLLSKEAVLSGEFEQRFLHVQGAFKREPFDEYFLRQIQEWRILLGEDIAAANPRIDEATLNICVQRIINRIIFLRICEDRSFEHYETLKEIDSYEELKALFAIADKKYDSGLFGLLEEDSLSLSDHVLIEIFRSLYYPSNSYEFSVVDPYIIGQIYELFLEEKLVIEPGGKIACERKPEVVDSQGVVNTPKNVTDIIVEQTLVLLYRGKTIEEVKDYRIADICCGSGNFLLSAYEYIMNFYLEKFITDEKEEALEQGKIYQIPGGSQYGLSYAVRREILTNNIWGTDIDPLAVEVTKFSLFLKALEGATAGELDTFSGSNTAKVLPDLERNIKNGNSLVDTSYAHFDQGVYRNLEKLGRIRMFDWKYEFGGHGFDAVIGNPPYIRVQNMVHYSPEEYSFYKSEYAEYQTASSDLLDKYYLFMEKGLSLLNPKGFLGYIVPHKFMTIRSGEGLRRLLSDKKSVRKIIHFGTIQVFKARSTYTCILILGKAPTDSFSIGFVQDWNRFLFEHDLECSTYPADFIGAPPWIFLPQSIDKKLVDLEDSCSELEQLADIFVGVQTSADKLYIIQENQEDEQYIYFTDKDNNARKIEKGILRKSVYDARLTRYEPIEANSYIIYPYREIKGKPVLYPLSEMEEKYPFAWEYLCSYKAELERRNMPGRNEENWYAYGRSQSIKRFMKGEHLIWPVLSLAANYVYDREMVVFTGGGNGPFYGLELKKDVRESIFYVQAVLNHWLLETLVKSRASTFRGGYYSHGKQFIAKLPIYRIDFSNREQVRLHDEIVEKVHILENLSLQRRMAGNHAQAGLFARSVQAVEQELNAVIDRLYGVQDIREGQR